MKNTPMSKALLILLAIAVLAVIGFVFYSHRATTALPVQVSETTPLPGATDWPSAKVSDATVTDNGSYYTINATYPVVKDATISGYFKSFVDDSVTQFKSDTSWAANNGANQAPAEAASLSLHITYTEEQSSIADNYIFATDTYTGGAHDLQATKTYSFSPTGQQIPVSGLFTNGDAGLKTIAPYVKDQLSASTDADASMIADGTAPTEANYENFTIESDGVTFIFDPYQVAPYSDGQQKVKVPLSVFKSIANPDIFTN
jgi:hypothetical protein